MLDDGTARLRQRRGGGGEGAAAVAVDGSGGRSRSRSPIPVHLLAGLGGTATAKLAAAKAQQRGPQPVLVRAALCVASACLIGGVAFALLLVAVVYSDTVATPLLSAVVRMHMPRPVKAAVVTTTGTDPTYRDVAALHVGAKARFDELWMAAPSKLGVPDFGAHRPSTGKYGKHQWLWDSMLHIVTTGHLGPLSRPVKELFALLSFQDDHTGFIPEMVYWEPDPNQGGIPGFLFGYSDARRTDITQMPILAFGLESINARLKEATKSLTTETERLDATLARLSVLCAAMPRIHRYHEWWALRRDPDGDSLVSIIHPWESGLDASPLYDDVHRTIRSRRGGPADWANASRPSPDELYPELILLLRRYKHKAKWQLSRILDPVAAQTRCEGDLNTDIRSATWDVTKTRTALARKLNAQPEHTVRPRAELERGSIIDGIFDVEDVGVNSVLAANADALARLYDDFIDTFERLPPSEQQRFGAQAEKADSCCWSRPTHSRRTTAERLATLRAKRDEMRRLAKAVGGAVADQLWDRDRRRFVSNFHTYEANAAAAAGQHRVCMRQGSLTRDTIQSLMPLLLPGDVLTDEMVSSMLDRLEDPEAYGGGPATTTTVPTVSRAESDVFEADDSTLMWRGPSWPTTNWFVAKGLQAIAAQTTTSNSSSFVLPATRERAARIHRDLVDRWTRMHLQHGFSEFHSPDTGAAQGQRGLGMSHTLIDVLHLHEEGAATAGGGGGSPSASQIRLMSPALAESVRSGAGGFGAAVAEGHVGELQGLMSSDAVGDLGRLVRRGVVKAPRPGLPSEGIRELLFPTRTTSLSWGTDPRGDTTKKKDTTSDPSAAAAAAGEVEDQEEEELLLEPSGAHGEWRVMPRLFPGCCY